MITVGELITMLQHYPPSLPVALRDLQDSWRPPSYRAAAHSTLERIPVDEDALDPEERPEQEAVVLG